MGFGTSRLKYFLLCLFIATFVDAESQRGSGDTRQSRQFRPTRRVLEPPIANEGLQERGIPKDHEGNQGDFLIKEDNVFQTDVLDDKVNDSLGARRGARFFRHEESGVDGKVKGQYGFVDANGDLHVIIYVTDSLGHRIRTETHKIEGYGHELTKILESGPSTAEVKNHIDRILSEQSSSGSSATSGTTGKPEITTAGFRRTTRSTDLPNDPEPYFIDEEPDSEAAETSQEADASSQTLSELAKFAALVDHPETKHALSRNLEQSAFGKAFSSVNTRPSLFDARSELRRTNSHTSRRHPLARASVVSPSARNGNSKFVVLNTTPRPEIFTDFSTIRKFGKDLSSSSRNSPTHPVFADRGLPLSLETPLPQSRFISQDQQQQIRDYLDQILRGSGTNIDDVEVADIRELDTSAVIEALESLLSRSAPSRAKNIAVFTLPERVIQSNDDSHIIHGEVIDGGIINAKEFISEQLNRNKNLINGGIIDGGIINDDIGDIPKTFNRGNIINGEIIDGGILDDSIINGGIINGGVIGIEDFTNFREPTTPTPFRNDRLDKERLMNLMALQKLLESDNAETFISLLNIERVVQSPNIDRLTKTMILDRMLASGDVETINKVQHLKRIVGTNPRDQPIIDLLKKKSLDFEAETNKEQVTDSFTNESSEFSEETDNPLSKSGKKLEKDTENLMKTENKDKTLSSDIEVKETETLTPNSDNNDMKSLEKSSEISNSTEDRGKDIGSDSEKDQDKEAEEALSSSSEENDLDLNARQKDQETTTEPTVIRGPDAIRIIPSPDLSTGRPGLLNQRRPVSSQRQNQISRPNTDFNVDYDGGESGGNDFGLISPQANWAIRPFSIASLSPHRSPVFINSTVYVTTTAAPALFGIEGSQQPRLIRPDLTGLGKSESSKPFLNRPRLNNNEAPLDESDVKSEEPAFNSSLTVSKDGKAIDSNSSSASNTAKSQEQTITRTDVETTNVGTTNVGTTNVATANVETTNVATTNVETSAKLKVTTPPTSQPENVVTNPPPQTQPVPVITPVPQNPPPPPTFPTTPTPIIPVAVSPPRASPYPTPYQLPNDKVPDIQNVQISTLPALPPIIENLPPIHVTTVLPPFFHHHHHRPHVTTPLPYHNRGFSHSQAPGAGLQHFHHRQGAHTRHGREFPLHPRNAANFSATNDLFHDLTHDRPPPPPEFPRENQGDSSRGRDGSHGQPQPRDRPFIPIQTPTHTISSGPHHVFIQKNAPRHSATAHSVNPTGKNHRTREASSIDNIEPVLHSGPPLIPSPQPVLRRGRASSQRLPSYRLKRRHERRAASRRMGSGQEMW
ncbi:serine-rich adhesin for platelets-like [Palaemon carinicauda]|uniref:serine-rich adhesin for platelets-like n=1 Tax=Palaemon carinicauda TaxID=392227 RepID=UPI0035B5937F